MKMHLLTTLCLTALLVVTLGGCPTTDVADLDRAGSNGQVGDASQSDQDAVDNDGDSGRDAPDQADADDGDDQTDDDGQTGNDDNGNDDGEPDDGAGDSGNDDGDAGDDDGNDPGAGDDADDPGDGDADNDDGGDDSGDGDDPGDGDNPGDGDDGDDDPDDDDPNDDTDSLTTAQADAVDRVTNQLAWVANVFATFSALTDERLDLDDMGQLITFGSCPKVQGVGGATPILNFLFTDEGCTSDRTGPALIQGPLQVDIVAATKTAEVTFEFSSAQHTLDFLTIDGHIIEGNTTATVTNVAGGVRLLGDCILTITDVVAANGDIDLTMTDDGALALDAPNLLLDDDEAGVDGVMFDPVGFGDFTPAGGIVTLTVDDARIVIAYDADTPIDGVVNVLVDGEGPFEHVLP